MERQKLNNRTAAEQLGCSKNTITNMLRNGAPYYMGLACSAISHDLDIPDEPSE
jgi:hypothetical protein